MDQRKLVFRHISRSALLNILSQNLNLHESFVSARKLFLREYTNCLTSAKIKGAKIDRVNIRSVGNLMGLRYPIDYNLLIEEDLCPAHYQILLVIWLKEFIKIKCKYGYENCIKNEVFD